MPFAKTAEQTPKIGKTIRIVLNQIKQEQGPPVLHCEFAGEGNQGYFNEVLADANNPDNEIGSRQISMTRANEFRTKVRGRLARHVVRHLENVFHDDGKEATDADIADYVANIPNFVFDELYKIVKTEENFLGGDAPASTAKATAGK